MAALVVALLLAGACTSEQGPPSAEPVPVRPQATPTSDFDPESTVDAPTAACDALAGIEAIDGQPQTAEQAREMFAEMSQLADIILESVPPELTEGATDLVAFFRRVSDLAESAAWSPAFIESLDDEGFAGAGIDIEPLVAFLDALEDACRP